MLTIGEELDDAVDTGTLPEEVDFASRFVIANGLGFLGGPSWHYPEEEIEFIPIDVSESKAHQERHKSGANMSSSGRSLDYSRITMSDSNSNSNSEAWDIRDDGHEPGFGCDSKSNSLSHQSPPFPPSTKRETVASITPRLRKERQRERRRRDRHRNSNDNNNSIKEQRLEHFRQAALCVPFEYTSNIATFYIRRPCGIATAPEIFQVLSPDTTDEDYRKQSKVSSSETIQVAIAISADSSLMLLYGSAGVRYKTNPSDFRCHDWIDVPDVGSLDVPLGYMNNVQRDEINQIADYSLDEVYEEAMLVREQYCNTILSTASELAQRLLLAEAKTPPPPSLTKSTVSTPPKFIYYYDGSRNNKAEDEEGQPEGRKLNFLQCATPTTVETGDEVSIELRLAARQKRQKQRRRRQLYRFCQRAVIVVVFYCSGIFLVANISTVDHHRPNDGYFAVLLSPSFNTSLVNSMGAWLFVRDAHEQQLFEVGVNEDEEAQSDIVVVVAAAAAEDGTAATTKALIESECTTPIQTATDKKNLHERKLEATETSLREQKEGSTLLQKYDLERTKSEELLREKASTVTLVQELIHKTENLALDLEMEQGQRRKLEETIRALENQIVSIKQEDKTQNMDDGSVSVTLTTRVHLEDEQIHLQASMEEDAPNWEKESNQTRKMSQNVFTPKAEERVYESEKLQVQQEVDTTEVLAKNPSLSEEKNVVEETNQLVLTDKVVSSVSKNEMQSMQNVVLKNAQAKKGPILPKMYRQVTMHLLPKFGINEEQNQHPLELFSRKIKVETLANSVKQVIANKVKTIFKEKRHEVINNDVDQAESSGRSRLARTRESISKVAKKEAELIRNAARRSTEIMKQTIAASSQPKELSRLEENTKEEDSSAFATIAQSIQPKLVDSSNELKENFKSTTDKLLKHTKENSGLFSNLVQSIQPKFVDNSKEVKEKLKSSTDKLVKQSKESSDKIRRQVKKNVNEVSVAGVRKMDHGREAVQVIGDFARSGLESVGKRVRGFALKKLEHARSQKSERKHRVVSSNYFTGFVGKQNIAMYE